MSDFDLPKGITMHRGKLRIAFRPPNEKQQWKRSLGIPPTKANIKAAEQMLNSIRRDISLGQFNLADYFPNDPSLKKDEKMLSHILQKHFLDAKKGLVKGSTHATYTETVSALMNSIDDVEIANLDARRCKLFREKIISSSDSSKSVNSRLWIVRTAVTRAISELDLDESAKDLLMFLQPVESKSKAMRVGEEDSALSNSSVYTIDEAERIVKATTNDNLKRLLVFMFWSGLRPGEAAALERRDICLPYIYVRRTLTQSKLIETPKTGRERKIYLPSFARSALELQLQTHDFERVWISTKGEPFTSSTMFHTSTWRRILERAGVEYKKFYITRHSFASWMLKAGEPEASVAAHLGHSDLSMVRKVYGKFIPDSKPEWTLDDPAKLEKVKKSMLSVI
ncbi:tyrosine-type recombinase/integrase [Pseudoalteromonas sp. SCSIO 43088]|uniref:tyrosine-type recombinase/integrase n=1 Tax=Pseudoalteromonas sp. SCSIO 43088 TaxID=2822846 RepID=UPI00202AF8F0|nr:tyrosine-type recombinase/integrase [Pseudoalteromonas sp. SCSIO 43088]URQ88275.1 tyrosine-type recombinase/integrase [Pseudoalteromonas sp. SCSIO 43088]